MNRSEADIDMIHQQESGGALLGFLMIEHPALLSPLRVVSSPLPYIWDGQTWEGVPFGYRLLTDTDAMPETELVVQNVDRRIGAALLSMTDRARVSLWVLTSEDFDTTVSPRVEIGTPTPLYELVGYDLINVTGDAFEIRGRVTLRDFTLEPFGKRATKARAPGLFV